MFPNVSSLIFNLFLAIPLMLLPGSALLRLTVPSRALGFLCRLAIAPGITVAVTVLLFTWLNLCGLKPGPVLPWLLILASIFVLIFVRRGGLHLPLWISGRGRRRFMPVVRERLRRVAPNEWLAGIALAGTLILFFVVRFHATWGWFVPPGVDSDQHAMIVQLLLDHHGLFKSWAPYNDAETFTYHFGFHAITAMFAWLSGLDVSNSIMIMGRVVGATAATSLFPLLRLWTRSAWGGVCAVVFWELTTEFLSSFDRIGRWTFLTGITVSTAALVLFAAYLRPQKISKQPLLGLTCAIIASGLALTQYRTAMIFAILVAALFASRCITEAVHGGEDRFGRILQITFRLLAVTVLALIFAAPRLITIREARTGHYLKHIVLDAPAANSNQFDRPKLTGNQIVRTGFTNKRRTIVTILALLGAALVAGRRREALWFVAGWLAVTLLMNPALVGMDRVGLIDEAHWKYAVEFAMAAIAGLAVGILWEMVGRKASPLWHGAFFLALIAFNLGNASRVSPVPDWCRYIASDELPLVQWIERNVPPGELIAGRSFLGHGEVVGYDATTWLPILTRHRTNLTNLAAGLEKTPPESRLKLQEFHRELHARDMSTLESARWMREQGYRWFYAGAIQSNADAELVTQLANNPGLELAQAAGVARIYHVR